MISGQDIGKKKRCHSATAGEQFPVAASFGQLSDNIAVGPF